MEQEKKEREGERKKAMEKVKDAYNDASGAWRICDWTHAWERMPNDDASIAPENSICDGDNVTCAYCTRVKHDAMEAETTAENGMYLWDVGKYMDAIEYLDEAVSLEYNYGDAPTWRPVLQAMKAYVETIRQKEKKENGARKERTRNH